MPRKPGGVTRALILEHAERLFLEGGYAGTSVRDIATACDVSVPALYHYYSSKDALVSAWCESFATDSERLIQDLAALEPHPPADRAAFERSALERYFDVVTRHERVFRVVSTDRGLRSHPLAGHRLAQLANQFLDLLTGPDPKRRVCAVGAIGSLRLIIRVQATRPAATDDLRSTAVACSLAALGAYQSTNSG